jgi:predicted nucleic acid-binding protein
MRVVLDTSVLWDLDALDRVGQEPGRPVLPAVAFTERARQLAAAGRSVEELWRLVADLGADVEPFSEVHGLRIAARLDDGTWRRHARDALIAGHVEDDDVLWTKNPRDFLAVGLRKDQVVAV